MNYNFSLLRSFLVSLLVKIITKIALYCQSISQAKLLLNAIRIVIIARMRLGKLCLLHIRNQVLSKHNFDTTCQQCVRLGLNYKIKTRSWQFIDLLVLYCSFTQCVYTSLHIYVIQLFGLLDVHGLFVVFFCYFNLTLHLKLISLSR